MESVTSPAKPAWSANGLPLLQNEPRPVASKQKRLTVEQRRQLGEELHVRMELMKELAQLTIKRLAARYDVHVQTVRRLDWLLHDIHVPDPTPERTVERRTSGIALAE